MLHPAIYHQINNKVLHVWDAVVAWRDYIFQTPFYNNTKGNYLSGMLKLIELDLINVYLPLEIINDVWIEEAKKKIDLFPDWSIATKAVRKSCLNSFYQFVQKDFNRSVTPYRRHPSPTEVKHVLSNVPDKALTKDISPIELCNALEKINKRDAYIVWLMMHTGEPLESILDRRKEHFRTSLDNETKTACLDFEDENGRKYSKHIFEHITEDLKELCKDSKVYLFETANGKRILRTQVMRTLKQAGHNIGLDFDLNPKILHGFVCAYMCRDKRSELEKAMGFSIN